MDAKKVFNALVVIGGAALTLISSAMNLGDAVKSTMNDTNNSSKS